MANNSDRVPSIYQQASQDYYTQLRKSHTGVYSSTARMEEERGKKRYTNIRPPQLEPIVQNLSSFITLLLKLCGPGPSVTGIDFGCGSHWFVDLVRNDPAFGWSAVGYDPDKCAIELARERFPQSADYYQCLDPIHIDLPESAESQSFVFSNAVLQHFDDQESERAVAEMSRVLERGGVCLLIFKCWDYERLLADGEMPKAPQVLDAAEHKVWCFDPTMKETIDQLSAEDQNKLDERTRDGWRLFHLFPVEQMIGIAERHGLRVMPDIELDCGIHVPGVITYHSGKKMPTACVTLRKQ